MRFHFFLVPVALLWTIVNCLPQGSDNDANSFPPNLDNDANSFPQSSDDDANALPQISDEEAFLHSDSIDPDSSSVLISSSNVPDDAEYSQESPFTISENPKVNPENHPAATYTIPFCCRFMGTWTRCQKCEFLNIRLRSFIFYKTRSPTYVIRFKTNPNLPCH